jgi:hyperosmotically inducible protein
LFAETRNIKELDMKAAFGSVLVAVALVALPAPVRAAAAQSTAVKPSDSTLDDRIEKRLNNSTLKRYSIDVSVDAGVAKLTGTVATEADRRKAAQLATIPGVARVDNQLVVDLNATKGTAGTMKSKVKEGAENTKEGVEKVGEKTKAGAEKVGEKTKEGLSKTGEVITDGWITTRVSSKFVGEDLLKDSDINVDTNNHVVTLRGTVMSAAGRARAIEQAKEVEGVHQVVDHLTIGPKIKK